MKLKDIPTVGNKITKQDEVLIDQVGDVVNTITEKMQYIPFTESVVILTGIIYGLLKCREEVLTSENAGFESGHDIIRFNYLIRLMNKKYGFDIEEVMVTEDNK